MKFSMIFQGVDRASKLMGKIMRAEQRMARIQKANAAASQKAIKQSQRANGLLSRSMGTFANATARAHRVAITSIRKTTRATKKLHRATIDLAKRGWGQVRSGAGKVARGLTVATGLMASAYGVAGLAAGKLVSTGSSFEKFQTTLHTTEGSALAAEKAMGWVQNFAVKTPYELDQVTGSFVKLRAYGLDPTNGLLRTLGDTSAAMGKPLAQAVEAIADAVTGENERLKEFGIKASKTGKLITYEYTNAAGKAMTASVKASDRMAIQLKLMSIMNEKYAGSMERLSGTWEGMMSNLADQWIKFQLMIMNSGLFDWMKEKLKLILDAVNQMEADGRLQVWATKIGETIKTTLQSAWDFAVRVTDIMSTFFDYLGKAAEFVGGWENLSMVLGGMVFGPTLVATAAGLIQIVSGLTALSAALIANPVGLAIAAIAGGVYLIYKNWDSISPYFTALWDGIKAGAQLAWQGLKALFKWTPLGILIENWSSVSKAIANPMTAAVKAVLVPWNAIKSLFDWSPLAALDETFGGIPGKISGYLSEAAELAGTAWNKLTNIFSDDSAVDIAVRDPVSIERATKAATELETILKATNTIDMSGVSGNINRLISEATALKQAIVNGVNAAQSWLANQSFHHHGERLMDTIAAGIRARAQVVVNEIKNVMQQVRKYLPSSPAKVGPLSDIHRLKFTETIAASIRPKPMVKAMRAAALATMAAAAPTLSPVSAATAGGQLPNASQARSVVATSSSMAASDPGNAQPGSASASITYAPTITIQGGGPQAEAKFKQLLAEHARDIKRIVDGEQRRQDRRKF